MPENQTTDELREASERLSSFRRPSELRRRFSAGAIRKALNKHADAILGRAAGGHQGSNNGGKKAAPKIFVETFDGDDGADQHPGEVKQPVEITPKKAARIVDKHARWVFPLLFGIFNIFYWMSIALS